MGMFDYIKCDYPVPGMPDLEWQTKDTDAQYLDKYVITKDGKLLHECYDIREVPPEDRPFPKAKKGTLESLCGIIERINFRWEEVPMRGDINFYSSDKNKKWWEYSALFDDGKLISIKPLAEGTHD